MGLDVNILRQVLAEDADALIEAEKHYGESWCRRGGVDSFMMLARKWDRIEHQVNSQYGFNILQACVEDQRPEGIMDDIRDLRRYLTLVEEKVRREYNVHNYQLKKNIDDVGTNFSVTAHPPAVDNTTDEEGEANAGYTGQD
jgi:hypothetical protein